MKKQRDDIIANDPMYEGETLQNIELEYLRDICRQAIERCQALCPPIANRFGHLRAQRTLEKRAEATWLTDALEKYFTKKWNDHRNATAPNKPPPTKKAACCDSCKKTLHCMNCEDIQTKVFHLLIVF
jgi:hypothetical protein